MKTYTVAVELPDDEAQLLTVEAVSKWEALEAVRRIIMPGVRIVLISERGGESE